MILNGAWAADQADQRALSELGNVLIEFEEDGRLTYIVRGKDKDQIIKLRYRIEGTTIITDQPSVPQVSGRSFL